MVSHFVAAESLANPYFSHFLPSHPALSRISQLSCLFTFAPRCVYAKPECFENEPQLEEIEKDHFVKCHFVREINGL